MPEKRWFLVKFTNGRPEIVSQLYTEYEDAKQAWDCNENTTICETIYG